MKVKTIISVIIFIFFLIPQTYAQFFVGVKGGVNKHYVLEAAYERFEVKPLYGYGIEMFGLYELKDWLTIRAALRYSLKRHEINTYSVEDDFIKFEDKYLSVLPGVQVSFRKNRFQFFGGGGPYTGFLLGSTWEGTLINNESTSFNPFVDLPGVSPPRRTYSFSEKRSLKFERKWEFGVYANIGFSYDIDDRHRIILEGNLIYALTNRRKKSNSKMTSRNHTYALQIGYAYRLNFKKKETLKK